MTPAETPSPLPPPSAEEPDDFQAMLIGAGIIVAVSFIPYASMACCLPHLIGAVVAVHLYTRKYGLTISYGKGIKLGVLTCLMGGLAVWVVITAVLLVFGYQIGAKDVEAITLYFAKLGGPEAVEKTKEALEAQKNQGISVGHIVIGLVSVSVLAAISGLIGGALGAALFKRGPR